MKARTKASIIVKLCMCVCMYILMEQIFFKEQKEEISQFITLRLEGIGLSLVDDEKCIEVAYIGIRP